MQKFITLCVVANLIGGLLCGVASAWIKTEDERFVKLHSRNVDGVILQTIILLDTKTGIKYLFVAGYSSGGLAKLEGEDVWVPTLDD